MTALSRHRRQLWTRGSVQDVVLSLSPSILVTYILDLANATVAPLVLIPSPRPKLLVACLLVSVHLQSHQSTFGYFPDILQRPPDLRYPLFTAKPMNFLTISFFPHVTDPELLFHLLHYHFSAPAIDKGNISQARISALVLLVELQESR